MDFERPYALLLILPALAALWLGQRRSLTTWPPRQRRTAILLRTGIVTALIAALSGPSWLGETTKTAVIFLRDVSASITPASREQAGAFIAESVEHHTAESGEIDFARDIAVLRPVGSPGPADFLLNVLDDTATNLAEALRLAAALLPTDQAGRIVLLSDGDFTTGDAPARVAQELIRRGIQVDVVTALPETRPDAAVTGVLVPEGIREGEMVKISATVTATTPLPAAQIQLFQNHLLVGETSQDLTTGPNAVTFPPILAAGNMAVYEVAVRATGDVVAGNNRARQAVVHGGAARTLLIDSTPAESKALVDALTKSGFAVDTRPPSGFPATLAELEDFDLVIFSDAPASAFRQEQLQMLASWVKDFGGGFLMIGGEGSFGAGGYAVTPLATLLPVRIEREQREETPVAAVLVILDRSGSMSVQVGGRPKMALANEGAVMSLDVLQSKDLFGAWAVDTRVQQVVPLGPVTDKAAASRKIAGITSGGGGIYIYTSLAEALPQIRDAKAKLKHIILFADASDAEEKTSTDTSGASPAPGNSALDLASALLASQVTLSVVALGSEGDRDTAFLRDLAARGGGRFYLTADATTLPRLFTQETMRATQSSLREDVFLIQAREPSEITAGLPWDQAPPLLGLNMSSPKPGSELLLETNVGDPLLLVWRYGLGQSAAFLSDAKARWASEWLAWDGYGKFWTQLPRKLIRPDRRHDLSATLSEDDQRLQVTVSAVSAEGAFRNGLPVTLTVAEPNTPPRTIPARQTAPGEYRASLEKPVGENAIIAVSDEAGRPLSLAWTRDEGREYRQNSDAEDSLRELAAATGGLFQPRGDEVFRPASRPVPTYFDLAPWLLGLAVLLWPLDIWCRRREWASAQ